MTDEHASDGNDVAASPEPIDEIRAAAAGQAAALEDSDAKEAIDRATAAVGKSDDEEMAGEQQTPQQATITGQDSGGISDADRKAAWKTTDGQSGRNPVPVGGSSAGQSDRRQDKKP